MKKTVLITGATDGIGKALAVLLSKEYNLALCGRNEDKMKTLLQELSDCHVYAECFDITDSEKRHFFCENVKKEFGTVDVLVNNTGGVDTNFRANANPNYLRPETVAKMIKVCIENEDGCVHDIVIRPDIENNIA